MLLFTVVLAFLLCDEMVEYIVAHRNQYLLGNSHFMLVALPENSKVHHINAWLLSLLDMALFLSLVK